MRSLTLPFITAILFAGSFVAGKFTVTDLGPLTTSLCRYLVALIFLSALIGHYKIYSLKVEPRDIGTLFLLGLTGIAGYHYFFFLSLRYTDVTNAAIINASSPVVTGFAASLLLRERLGRHNKLGIGLAFVGVLVLLTRGDIGRFTQWQFNIGDLLMILAVLCWAAYALLLKKMSNRYASYTLTFYAVVAGVIILAFLAIPEEPIRQITEMSGTSLYSILYMGLFASGLGYLLYTHCVAEIGPTRTSGSVYALVPVFTAILAWVFFSQVMTIPMLFSLILVVIGLWLILK